MSLAGERVKVVFAGLLVFVGVTIGIAVVSSHWPTAPLWLLSIVMASLFLALTIAALVLFNAPGGWRLNKLDHAAVVKELEDQGLLASETFNAKRAFQVEEFEDEGSHYYLELEDGRVLFLSGQYLYDYEPLKHGNTIVQPRRFPNTQFVVRRHVAKHYVVDILCGGPVIEPEVLAPSFSTNDFGTERIPEDGQVIRDRSFEQLKDERLKHFSH
jgi:hypothetical protein